MTLAIMAIPLTQGLFALVDGETFEWLNQWKWYATKKSQTYYAARMTSRKLGKQKQIFMHREILGLTEGDGKEADHQNHYGLDNRILNLQIATKTENRQNKSRQNQRKTKGTSQYKGVYLHKARKKWRATIDSKYIGCFATEKAAAEAYDRKAKKLFGEFAYLNFS